MLTKYLKKTRHFWFLKNSKLFLGQGKWYCFWNKAIPILPMSEVVISTQRNEQHLAGYQRNCLQRIYYSERPLSSVRQAKVPNRAKQYEM